MANNTKDIKPGQIVEKTAHSGLAARFIPTQKPADTSESKPEPTDGANTAK